MSHLQNQLTKIDLAKEAAVSDIYKNIPLSFFNDHVVRLAVMTESFYWHLHPNSDETFLGVEGIVCIELENETIELGAGQLVTIPANTKHRTYPKNGRSVNLTFELADMQTVKL